MSSYNFTFGRRPTNPKTDYFVYNIGRQKAVISENLRDELISPDMRTALLGTTLIWFAFNGFWQAFGVYDTNDKPPKVKTEFSKSLLPMPKNCVAFLKDNQNVSPRVVFGPGATVLCWSLDKPEGMNVPRSAVSWDTTGFPKDAWADADKALRGQNNLYTKDIRNVALGVDGAYWIQPSDKEKPTLWDLKRSYTNLQGYIDGMGSKLKIDFLALHPQDENQYFLIDDKKNIRACLSATTREQLKQTLIDDAKFIGEVVIIPSEPKGKL